ncbi:hypothetical protein L917_10041 [Phytophthora nicotianae]|uniref:Uncharacterized protein n=1 Tax=Phytophthora nicotianae TaxID=4792 RepID=W2L217_PHYNI|nr:hypothetical protein L917_10041 [Phytophthora nicotianae]
MPRTDDQVPWKCPRSGIDKQLEVGQVVEFAFYKDGNRAAPASVNLGETYFDIPEPRRSQRRMNSRSTVPARPSLPALRSARPFERRMASPDRLRDRLHESARSSQPTTTSRLPDNVDEEDVFGSEPATRFTDLLAALASDEPAPKHRRITPPVTTHGSEPGNTGAAAPDTFAGRPQPTEGVPSIHHTTTTNAILAVLAPHPHLLIEYVQQLKQLRTATTSSTASPAVLLAPTTPPPPLPTTVVGKCIGSGIYNRRGRQKLPSFSTIADSARSSSDSLSASIFSLSVLHFPHWNINAQIDRKKMKAVNMRNFSPKVELPDILEQPEYKDLVEALSVIQTFAQEFFDDYTQAFVAATKQFGDRLFEFSPWSSREIVVLAYWFTSVFGTYRAAVVHDVSSGLTTRNTVKNRFSMQDGELSNVLFKVARETS